MKNAIKIILLIILLIIITANALGQLENNITSKKDVGVSFLDIDKMNDNDVYLLWFYSDEINVLSQMHKPVSLVWQGIRTSYGIIKNRKMVSQNYNVFSEHFNKKQYMRADIYNEDYNSDNVCEIKLEVIPSMENEHSTLFIGDTSRIDEFLDRIIIIKTIVITLVIIAAVLSAAVGMKKKDLYLAMQGVFLLLSLYNFEIFIKAAVVSAFFINLNIIRNRLKLVIFMIAVLLAAISTPNGEMIIASLVLFIVIRIYDLSNSFEIAGVIPTAFLGILIGVTTFNYYALKVFYNEVHLIAFVLMITVYLSYYLVRLSNKYDSNVSSELLRGVSHDFKIPLAVIKLNQELVGTYLITEAERNSATASINTAVNDLEKMISSLTAFLSKKRYVGSKYNASIKSCFDKIQKSFENYTAIDFSVICDEHDTILPIDPIWFNRLIYNLVDNAFKYSKESGERVVKLEYIKLKRKVIIVVTDNGIGMKNEELNKIFMPFYRVDKSQSKSGLGLGLAIIKDIVNQLEGEIKITSEKGEGTTVAIEIKAR